MPFFLLFAEIICEYKNIFLSFKSTEDNPSPKLQTSHNKSVPIDFFIHRPLSLPPAFSIKPNRKITTKLKAECPTVDDERSEWFSTIAFHKTRALSSDTC